MLTRLVALLFTLAVITTGCAAVSETLSPYPTDSVMEDRFRENRDGFEKLLAHFQEDHQLQSVNKEGDAWIDVDKPADLSPDRTQLYRDLLSELQVLRVGRNRSEEGKVYLRVWWVKNGPFLGSKSKYYLYSKSEPPPPDSLMGRNLQVRQGRKSHPSA